MAAGRTGLEARVTPLDAGLMSDGRYRVDTGAGMVASMKRNYQGRIKEKFTDILASSCTRSTAFPMIRPHLTVGDFVGWPGCPRLFQ